MRQRKLILLESVSLLMHQTCRVHTIPCHLTDFITSMPVSLLEARNAHLYKIYPSTQSRDQPENLRTVCLVNIKLDFGVFLILNYLNVPIKLAITQVAHWRTSTREDANSADVCKCPRKARNVTRGIFHRLSPAGHETNVNSVC